MDEVIDVLAAEAPDLHEALDRARGDGRTYNTLQRSLRCLGERGFALLTGRWRTLHHVTASPGKIGDIVRAALVLTFRPGLLV